MVFIIALFSMMQLINALTTSTPPVNSTMAETTTVMEKG